jgi:monovalent cation:H+ antiporter-2, CPA2 family
MPDITVLRELLIVLLATIAIVFVFQKLRIPAIVGFLLTGVIIGPDGLGFIADVHQIEFLAEIGVVLLLFTIGIEFSLGHLLAVHHLVIWAGVLQILLTSLVVFAVSLLLDNGLGVSILYAFLVSLSSTAIVLKILTDRGEIDSIQGKLATGILLLQDLAIVPMMLLVPILGGSQAFSVLTVGWALGKGLLVLLLIVLAARAVLPWLLRQVAQLRNREIFLLFVILICMGTAWLTSEAGLSLAIGAFIAGLVISESEFSPQIIADILPLRDSFGGIFFISIGMLLNLDFLAHNLLATLSSLALILFIKGAVIFVVFWWLYRSVRLGVLLGFTLAQIGEFSFILAKAGKGYGLLTDVEEQAFLGASILSMIATPFLMQWAHGAAYGLESMVTTPFSKKDAPSSEGEGEPPAGHVIVLGYGLNGQNLSRVLKEVGIPYRILEMDPEVVRRNKVLGEPIVFGDGTRPEVLHKVGIEHARILVVAISDPIATARVAAHGRRLRPDLYIIVRTRYVAEIEHLYHLGANQVIPEEFETSVEIFARVLQEYHVPRNVISLQVDLIRREHYGTLRGLHLQGRQLDQLSRFLAGTTTDIFLVQEGSPAIGKSLEALELRSRIGVTVIAVVREEKSTPNPPSDFVLQSGDAMILLGSHKALDDASQILSPPRPAEEAP